MPHEFEVREEIELAATPDQVWQAIATGPGVDSWFMGRTEIEGREGGALRFTMGGHSQHSTMIAWEPGRRLKYETDKSPDGEFMAFEYLIEGREGGSTTLRLVHNGFLGDDWEEQYDALSKGDGMYLRKLAMYLKHFMGRTAMYNMLVPGPQAPDSGRVWAAFLAAFGLSGSAAQGDPARISVPGLPPAEGTVEFAREPMFLGGCTDEGLYMLVHGMADTVVAEYHAFTAGADPERTERAWRDWLTATFG